MAPHPYWYVRDQQCSGMMVPLRRWLSLMVAWGAASAMTQTLPAQSSASAVSASQDDPTTDPTPDPAAVVACGAARFTVLSDSLIRLEATHASDRAPSGGSFDDRATSVVVNRRFPVPKFSVARPNASAVTITTATLRLTYSSPTPTPPTATFGAAAGGCGCTDTACTDTAQNISWQVLDGTQGADGKRTPSCPNGLTNQTLVSCFCACMADADCEGLTYAPPGKDLAKSCWLLTDVSKTISAGDRTFVGDLSGGGASKGFDDSNLVIEFLDPAAPVKFWRPSTNATRNLNGSYTNLDCYTVPEKCAAQNTDKLQPGLLSRDGWAVWDDIKSRRMTASNSSAWTQWHMPNHRSSDGSQADLYFFGHALDYKGALRDFVTLSGPPGLLSVRMNTGLYQSLLNGFCSPLFGTILLTEAR